MKIGIAEIIVICVIALVVLGPEKLPIYAKKLGASLKEVKKVTGDLSKDIRENIVEPVSYTHLHRRSLRRESGGDPAADRRGKHIPRHHRPAGNECDLLR